MNKNKSNSKSEPVAPIKIKTGIEREKRKFEIAMTIIGRIAHWGIEEIDVTYSLCFKRTDSKELFLEAFNDIRGKGVISIIGEKHYCFSRYSIVSVDPKHQEPALIKKVHDFKTANHKKLKN